METLTQLQQNRRVIQDFTSTTLAVIPSPFARLAYMASLRDLSSGRYEHDGLMAVYQREPVQQALQQCHEHVRTDPVVFQSDDFRRVRVVQNRRALDISFDDFGIDFRIHHFEDVRDARRISYRNA